MQSSFKFLPLFYNILFPQNIISSLHYNLKNNYENKNKPIMNSSDCNLKKAIYKNFSRSFSFAHRTFRVCFGSEMRLSCAYIGFFHRPVIIYHFLKYTNDIFNFAHTFFLSIIIHVLSVLQAILGRWYLNLCKLSLCHSITLSLRTVHNLFGWRFLIKPGESNFLLIPLINFFLI